MFGIFSKVKLLLVIGSIIAMVAAAGLWYYKDTQKRLATYATNQALVENALETQKTQTLNLLQDIRLMSETINELNADFVASRQKVQELENTFNKSSNGKDRDFTDLALRKPGLVEKIVNTATADTFRCIELLSGKEPTEKDEKNAKLKDCFNSSND